MALHAFYSLLVASSGGNPHSSGGNPAPERQLTPAQQQLASDLQEQRVIMVRAALRLGQAPQSGVVQQFLYR